MLYTMTLTLIYFGINIVLYKNTMTLKMLGCFNPTLGKIYIES